MSSQTNNAYVTKSLNGIISYDDGAGGVMEGGVITANELRIDAIQSTNPPNVVSLFTDTTTIINCGSSTSVLNVSNLNVSTINLPSITFTTLNVSNANSSISNSSTSNSSTSNSSTSNSSTSNSSTSNSSTSNSSTANNGTTNSTTSNASTANATTSNTSTSNVSTANNETTNTSTINVSTSNGTSMYMDNIYTNNIQNISTANVSLYTGYTGNIFMGDISTNIILIDSKNSKLSSVNDTTIEAGGEIYLNSNGNTQICNTGFGGKLVLSGNQEIRAKDRSAKSYLFTDAFTGGDVEFGNASTTLFINSAIKTTTINTSTANISTLNASTANISTLNVSTKNASTINATTINTSTLNASTTNAINTNASYISCQELYTDYGELGNIAFSNETISTTAPASTTITMFPTLTTGGIDFAKNMTTGITTIGSSTSTTKIGNFNISANQIGITSPTATIDLFPTLTTGTINIATNVTSAGAISIGQAAATGSFSVSEGTININPKTTLNIANQIGGGTSNICNNNTYAGTLNIAATAHASSAQNNLNIGSATSNIFIVSRTISLSTADTGIIIAKPILPIYSYNATTGTPAGAIGNIALNNTPASFLLATNDAFYDCQRVTLSTTGVYMIFVDNKLYNNNSSGSILIYYMRVMVGTTLGSSNVFSGYFNAFAEVTNSTGPNSQLDSPFTLPYVNTTAGQILYTRIRVGRNNNGMYWDSASFIRAVKVA